MAGLFTALGVLLMVGASLFVRYDLAARKKLAQSERFLQSVLDALASQIAVLDESGTILSVNAAWRRVADANRSARLAIGDNYFAACEATGACHDGPELSQGMRDVISGRRETYLREYASRDSHERWFLLRVTRFPGDGPARAVVAHEDITPRVLSERENARLYLELRESENRKDEFLAMLGHELRNPLAGIVTGIQVLRVPSPAEREIQAVIERQAGHMTRIVDDLLDVSRIVRGKLVLQRERLDLADLVRQTVGDYRQSLQIGDCQLAVELTGAPVWVSVDRTRLAQAVTNLIHNACKFSDGEVRVTVRVLADREANIARVIVEDEGIGMTPETLARIFEPFSQADGTLDRSRGGLGLGLALVKGLIDLHGGTVLAASPGAEQGSRFVIELPMTEAPQVSEARPASLRVAQPRKVLLVDDRRDAIVPLERMLESAGHQVAVAMDGPGGLKVARSFRPDVILCDIGLPGMSGYDVAQAVRSDPEIAGVYLVAVSGYGRESDRLKAQAAGFDYHLIKPVGACSLEQLMSDYPRFQPPETP